MYIKINGKAAHYNVTLEPFTTQHGYDAVRFVGEEVPETNKGFKVFDDDDNEMFDLSRYIYFYGYNEFCVANDEIEDTEPGVPSPIQENAISKKFRQMNQKIASMASFEETKTAYFGEKDKSFYNIPEGNVSVFFTNYDGDYSISRVANRFMVIFPNRLEDKTDITVMVQK